MRRRTNQPPISLRAPTGVLISARQNFRGERFPKIVRDKPKRLGIIFTVMNTTSYDIIIDQISSVVGNYPGTVEVSFHREGGNLGHGVRDGFETRRVPLPSEAVNDDGTMNDDEIYKAVRAAIGETEEVELEEQPMNKAAQQLGRRGGRSISAAKAAAARANGSKGGRPKKTPPTPQNVPVSG